jgi:hypothetical protein
MTSHQVDFLGRPALSFASDFFAPRRLERGEDVEGENDLDADDVVARAAEDVRRCVEAEFDLSRVHADFYGTLPKQTMHKVAGR